MRFNNENIVQYLVFLILKLFIIRINEGKNILIKIKKLSKKKNQNGFNISDSILNKN